MPISRPAADDDQARDPAHAELLTALAGPEPAPAASPRRRPKDARQPGPDSTMGLARYFDQRCPAPSWTHGMQVNSLRGLAAMFREMREHGMSADQIRVLIDLYFSRLGDTVPRTAYWLHFKGRRWALLRALEETGTARTGGDYDGWSAPAERQEFAGGWQ